MCVIKKIILRKISVKSFVFVFAVLVLFSCKGGKNDPDSATENTLSRILDSGEITAVVDFNSTNYFIYRGTPMGFQYDLLKHLADHLGVQLNLMVDNNIERNFESLLKGKCDIIAINLTVTKERSKQISFTVPHTETRQVLVQRKSENWRILSNSALENQLIRNQLELAGKVVYVQANSSYAERLKNLSDEIGDTIHIIETVQYEVEELINLVANGEIDYTIADENVARVNKTYHPNIDIQTAISFPQKLAWGVRKSDDSLLVAINTWMEEFKESLDFKILYNKYFVNRRINILSRSDFYSINSGEISNFDDYFRKYSERINWDWRLLASLVYQESRFIPDVRSWAGAYGLMQLMPTTAQRFGVSRNSPPEENIRAGVEFIEWLDQRFISRGITDEEERIKFILASYNVGLGHILDARRLAEKYGKDPNVWEDNVDEFILKKSHPEFFTDSVVRYGYCRGTETYNYVHDIIDRFEHYKNLIEE